MTDYEHTRDYNDIKLHTCINQMNCAICLNTVRTTRQTKGLECGHTFHTSCISKWKRGGGQTCPLCREEIEKPLYRITLSIKNVHRNTEQELNLTSEDQLHRLFSLFDTDITIDISNNRDLESFFDDIGLSLSDLDPLVLDTER